MTTILDAYHQCWMQFRPAKVPYSDGEGAFNNDAAKVVLKAKGTELRMHARGQHATTIEAIMVSYAMYFTSWRLNSIG
eukprot:4578101-Pyramimonas_sp.AAC.1